MIGPVPAIASGLSAIRRAVDRLDAAAAVASTAFLPTDPPPAGPPDLAGALVEMMLARREAGIGAGVVARASAVQRDLLDLLV
jgi:hypothetical protein